MKATTSALFFAATLGLTAAANADVITSTPGLLYYLNTSSGVISSGGVVSAWNDLSVNGNNFSQGTVGDQPTLTTVPGQFANHQVVQFNGSTDFLTLPSATTPQTVFIVGSTTLANDFLGGPWGAPGQDYGIRLDVSGTGPAPPFRAASSSNANGGDLPTTLTINGANTSAGGLNTPFVLAATGNAGSTSFTNSALGDYFGTPRYWGGNIAAIAVYSGTLSTADQTAIIKALGGQFGIATPEPSSLILCGLGAAGLLVAARRRRKA